MHITHKHTHITHISYTYHTHTYHTHITYISHTFHTHITHISHTYHTHPIIHCIYLLTFASSQVEMEHHLANVKEVQKKRKLTEKNEIEESETRLICEELPDQQQQQHAAIAEPHGQNIKSLRFDLPNPTQRANPIEKIGELDLTNLCVPAGEKIEKSNADMQKRSAFETLATFAENENGNMIESIVASMKHDISNVGVVKSACEDLLELASSSVNRELIGKAGGIEQIIEAMKHHGDDADIQYIACAALSILAQNPQNREVIGKVGRIARIIDAMDCHIDNADVQQNAYSALWILTLRIQNKIGGIERIIRAMGRHLRNANI